LTKAASLYLSSQLKADVTVAGVRLGLGNKIELKDVGIRNSEGLNCKIKEALIAYGPLFIIKKGTKFDFSLKDVEFSYPSSKVINGIASTLSLEPMEIFKFKSVKGEFLKRGNETVVKSLDAEGVLLRLFADGTIIKDSKIDYSFKILLSQELVAGVPGAIREVLFKETDSWSEVELYITGDIQKPSVNLTTDLFKLTVR